MENFGEDAFPGGSYGQICTCVSKEPIGACRWRNILISPHNRKTTSPIILILNVCNIYVFYATAFVGVVA